MIGTLELIILETKTNKYAESDRGYTAQYGKYWSEILKVIERYVQYLQKGSEISPDIPFPSELPMLYLAMYYVLIKNEPTAIDSVAHFTMLDDQLEIDGSQSKYSISSFWFISTHKS